MPLLHDCCGLERDVLVQLAALTEPRGAEIVEAIDEAYPSGMNQSRIYQILQSLERNGLARRRRSVKGVLGVDDGACFKE